MLYPKNAIASGNVNGGPYLSRVSSISKEGGIEEGNAFFPNREELKHCRIDGRNSIGAFLTALGKPRARRSPTLLGTSPRPSVLSPRMDGAPFDRYHRRAARGHRLSKTGPIGATMSVQTRLAAER